MNEIGWIIKVFLCRVISDSHLLQRNDRVSLVKRYNFFIDVSFCYANLQLWLQSHQGATLLQLTVISDFSCTESQLWTFLGLQTVESALQQGSKLCNNKFKPEDD